MVKRKSDAKSQLMELFLHVAELLGKKSDREISELAGVSVENVANWRSGAVQEFKPQKLKAIKDSVAAQIGALREQARLVNTRLHGGLTPIEIEVGSGPADLLRQLRDRVGYDYLGHRFLYFDPQGSLAWENLVRGGYDQERWLMGVESCASSWLDARKNEQGKCKGPIAETTRASGRGKVVGGLDVVSLGPGEGEKEVSILKHLLDLERKPDQSLSWLAFAPVDVSIPLLLTAANAASKLFASAYHDAGSERAAAHATVLPFCADFEEGRLSFQERLPTAQSPASAGTRLILMLGNTFGNLRDEETFVRQRLWSLARPGDLVWFEIGLRMEHAEHDPLYRLTLGDREETSSEANRRLLLEGPYRRWESASGRMPSSLDMRIWLREDDDASRVPGSCNYCHDLVIKDERRVCTMLYSRRYEIEGLTSWFERLGFRVLRIQRVEDSKQRPRVAHLLLERT